MRPPIEQPITTGRSRPSAPTKSMIIPVYEPVVSR